MTSNGAVQSDIPIPPVQLLGGDSVLLRGPAVVDTWRLVALGIDQVSRRGNGGDGIPPHPRLTRLLRVLEVAAAGVRREMSPTRHGDVAISAVPSQSDPTEQIGSKEAAQMLGLTQRQVQRIAPSLDGRRAGRGLVFYRGAVEAYAAHRHEEIA